MNDKTDALADKLSTELSRGVPNFVEFSNGGVEDAAEDHGAHPASTLFRDDIKKEDKIRIQDTQKFLRQDPFVQDDTRRQVCPYNGQVLTTLDAPSVSATDFLEEDTLAALRQGQEPPRQPNKSLARRLVKYFPLAVWFILLIIGAVVATVLLAPRNTQPVLDREGADTLRNYQECLRRLRYHLIGVEAERPGLETSLISATEWLASEDKVCGYLGLNSTRLEQRFALLTIQYSLGAGESTMHGWNNVPGLHECEWFGIECDTTRRHVVSIVIESGEARGVGHLPEEVGILSRLTNLDLRNGRVHGSLPTSLYSLTNLEILDLSNNFITGRLSSSIGELTKMRSLNLQLNALTGGIPSAMVSLGRLRHLDVRENSLSGAVWDFVESWPLIEWLDVSRNRELAGTIPTTIGALSHLTQLKASETGTFGSLPTEIGNLSSLTTLYLIDTRLAGSLPTEMGQLLSIEVIDVNHNDIGGTIPTEIGLCTSLHRLSVKENDLTGTLPSELGLLTELKTFEARANFLQGTIPDTFEQLTNLEVLDLHFMDSLLSVPPGLCSRGIQIYVACSVSCTCCVNCKGAE